MYQQRSWNIIQLNDSLVLLNSTGTIIRKHSKVPFGIITSLLSKMEEIGLPIDYTDGINEIYFTYLHNALEGDYDPVSKSIRLSCKNIFLDSVYKAFVHELGHHLDEEEGFSNTCALKDEYMKQSLIMENTFDVKPAGLGAELPDEYFALGFELYHSHTDGLNIDDFPHLHMIIDKHYKRIK